GHCPGVCRTDGAWWRTPALGPPSNRIPVPVVSNLQANRGGEMAVTRTERGLAVESEIARCAVDAEKRAAGLRIRATYQTFDAVEPWECARSELAVGLAIHVNRAGAMLDLAVELVERCPAILEEIEAGRIDERTAMAMVSRLRGVTDQELCREAAALAARRYI